MDGSVWGTTAVSGAGHRSNYAVTGELRLPLHDMLTVTGSGRYDAFKIGSNTVDKSTYSIGIEFRPIESLLFRGKYGTAFRAPTLSDAFQGRSGYYANGSTDYYRCGQLGYAPSNTAGCPYDSVSVFGTRSGNRTWSLSPLTSGTRAWCGLRSITSRCRLTTTTGKSRTRSTRSVRPVAAGRVLLP